MTLHKKWKNEQGFAKFCAEEKLKLEVSERIIEKMEELNISKKNLAEKLNKTPPAISRFLNGENNMTLKTVSDICWALGLEMTIRFENKSQEKQPTILKMITYSTVSSLQPTSINTSQEMLAS